MWGLGKNDNEQRMWNFSMFNMPLTDKEIEDSSGTMVITFFVVIVGVIIYWIW
jgi:hypothetical protein